MKHNTKKILTIIAWMLMCLLAACGEDTSLHTHAFGQWETITEASCTVEGLQERKCDCGEKQTRRTGFQEHDYQEITTVEPTCVTAGEKKFACACGTSYTEKISALGHDYQNYVFNDDASCVADGTETGTCSRCSQSHTRTALRTVLGHDYQNYVFNDDASCIADGTETGACSRCPQSHTRTALGTILGHDYQNYVFNDDASCIADGTETGTCSRCPQSHTRTALGTVLGHDFRDYASNDDATCIADGTQSAKCERCDVINTCTEVGSVKSHVYEDGICKTCSAEKIATSPGLEFTINEDGRGYTVTGIGNCTDVNIIIPRRYNGLPVTAIGAKAFYECGHLESVVIQKDIITIGEGAFQMCYLMSSITIADGVTSIGASAFEGCGYLKSVRIPASVTQIGYGAFFFCHELERVYVEDIVSWCKISFDGVGANPLANSDLYLNGERVTALTIPAEVEAIGNYAFSNCLSLTSVTIENGAASIGDYGFSWCFGLTTVTMGDSVTRIGEATFRGCSQLKTVSISGGLTAIDEGAFQWCDKLSTIQFRGTQEQWQSVTKATDWDSEAGEYTVVFGGEEPEPPELKLTVSSITFSVQNGFSWDLYNLVDNKEAFDQSAFVCTSGDESVVRMDGTVATGVGNSASGGVKITIAYDDQSVILTIYVREVGQDNTEQTPVE